MTGRRMLEEKKKKLVMILTEEGLLDAKVVSAHFSAEEIESELSETYSLNSIQWIEIRTISNQALEILEKKFGAPL